MADKYVLTKIDDKPGVFFKKMIPYWYYQLTYSVTFKKWAEEEEQWRVDDVKEAGYNLPSKVNGIANIVRCLEEQYSDEIYDYKNYTYVTLAIHLYKKYQERIEKYMFKKSSKVGKMLVPIHTKEEAWKEFVLRGFVPEFFNIHNSKQYYLKTTIGNMVLVLNAKTTSQAQQEQKDWGIRGYTGYNEPK